MKGLVLGLATIFLVATEAKAQDAGMFLEPMVTWERGRGDVDFPDPYESSETELDGFGVGARLGFHVMDSVFLAADGRYSWPNFKENQLGQDADAKAWNIGPVIGIQMPTLVGLRVWAGWVVAGEVDPDRSQDVKERFESGQGYRIGAGLKFAAVSLNIEYQKIKYDSVHIQDVGQFTPNTSRDDIKLDNDSMILSVSFPIGL